MSAREWFECLRESIREYAEDKSPWARAILGVYLVYGGIRHILDPLYRTWFGGLTLVFHEMGHIVFSAFGRTWTILGGSVMQLVVPAIAAIYLLVRQRDWFGFAVGKAWLAFSLWDLATYIADANKEELPLVSLGGAPEHDWSTLLTQWGLLNACETIAALTRTAAFVIWSLALALASWLLVEMRRASRASTKWRP